MFDDFDPGAQHGSALAFHIQAPAGGLHKDRSLPRHRMDLRKERTDVLVSALIFVLGRSRRMLEDKAGEMLKR